MQKISTNSPSSQPQILFIFPNYPNGRSFQGFDYHLGTGYIRAFLKERGIHTEQFIHTGNETLSSVIDILIALDPPMMGFTCYDINYSFVKLLAEGIRRRNPGIHLICGGPTATFSSNLIMEDCKAIDVCVRSYGEETSLELYRWMQGEQSLYSISGITYREGSEIVQTVAPRMPEVLKISDESSDSGPLDIFPDPYLEGMIPFSRASDIGIITSRGCVYPCTYCNFSAMSGWKVKFHSIKRVMAILNSFNNSLQRNDGIKTRVTINDDNFSLNGKRFHRLLEQMAAENFQHISFWAEMRTESLKDHTFPLLIKAGFTELNFGLESGVPRVLSIIKKVRKSGGEKDGYLKERQFLDRISWSVKKAREVGLVTVVSIILGCPGETEEEGLETLNFVKKLEVDRYYHNFMVVQRGTELQETYKDYGLRVQTSAGKILPQYTYYTYDVSRLPIYKNDLLLLPENGLDILHAYRLLCGSLETNIPLETSQSGSNLRLHVIPLIGITGQLIRDDLFPWLREEIPLMSSTWILFQDPAYQLEFNEKLTKANVPIQSVDAMRNTSVEEHPVWRVNELFTNAPGTNTRTIHTLSLSSINMEKPSLEFDQQRSYLFVTLDRDEDIRALTQWGEPGNKRRKWWLPGSLVKSRFSFVDGCRWCSAPCPAASGPRWLIDGQGEIKPCLSGQSLGKVGDSFSQLKKRAAEMMVREYKRRGCDSCPAKNYCSRCLFTAPMSVKDYCAIRRQNPHIAHAVDGLSLIKTLRFSTMPQPEGSAIIHSMAHVQQGHITIADHNVPFNQCLMVTFDNYPGAFVFHGGLNLFYSISLDQKDILEAIIDS